MPAFLQLALKESPENLIRQQRIQLAAKPEITALLERVIAFLEKHLK